MFVVEVDVLLAADEVELEEESIVEFTSPDETAAAETAASDRVDDMDDAVSVALAELLTTVVLSVEAYEEIPAFPTSVDTIEVLPSLPTAAMTETVNVASSLVLTAVPCCRRCSRTWSSGVRTACW